MARYQREMQVPGLASSYAPSLDHYMINEGFKLINYKGQKVWKKGVGFLTAPQYFSIQYMESAMFLEAFIRYPILPGLYVGEMGIDGFFGGLPKSLLRNRVRTVENFISSLSQDAHQEQSSLT